MEPMAPSRQRHRKRQVAFGVITTMLTGRNNRSLPLPCANRTREGSKRIDILPRSVHRRRINERCFEYVESDSRDGGSSDPGREHKGESAEGDPIAAGATLAEALAAMVARRVSRLPVAGEGGGVAGAIGLADLVR